MRASSQRDCRPLAGAIVTAGTGGLLGTGWLYALSQAERPGVEDRLGRYKLGASKGSLVWAVHPAYPQRALELLILTVRSFDHFSAAPRRRSDDELDMKPTKPYQSPTPRPTEYWPGEEPVHEW